MKTDIAHQTRPPATDGATAATTAEPPRTLRLRLGAPVNAMDGHFGELVDIVVDPVERSVTHLVVDPRDGHRQARLVPIELVDVELTGGIDVALASADILDLDRVSFVEFVRLGEPIEVGDRWDLGHELVLSQPYWSGPLMMTPARWTGQGLVRFDRVPKGECEIRRESAVLDRDGHRAGHVEGLIVEGPHITAVVVRVSTFGLHHFVAVPLELVGLVSMDQITLTIDRSDLDDLPRLSHELAPPGSHLPSPLEAQAGDLLRRARAAMAGARRWTRAVLVPGRPRRDIDLGGDGHRRGGVPDAADTAAPAGERPAPPTQERTSS